MNFFFFFTTLNYKPWNSVAIHLKHLYPGSRFAGIISAHGNIKKYLENQKEIEYEFLYDIYNIEAKFIKEDLAEEEVREFEET